MTGSPLVPVACENEVVGLDEPHRPQMFRKD